MARTDDGDVRRPLRVVQWTTGNVARQTVRALLARDDLELVGVFAYSPEKVGRDVAELIGLDEPVGVKATDDVEALIALHPDCVVYSSLVPNVDELSRLLRAGVNVVTSSAFLNGRSLGGAAREAFEAAGPEQDDLGAMTTDFHAIGMTITGVPVVNAIPAACAAAPGIRTYADLPVITAKLEC